MSRIGRAPITLPAGVEIDIGPGRVGVKGPRGTLEQTVPHEPQLLFDVMRLAHTPPQLLVPVGQAHEPLTHTRLPPHTL